MPGKEMASWTAFVSTKRGVELGVSILTQLGALLRHGRLDPQPRGLEPALLHPQFLARARRLPRRRGRRHAAHHVGGGAGRGVQNGQHVSVPVGREAARGQG